MAKPPSLFNRNFLLLWQGQAVSQLGNQAFAVVMMFWTMEATGSASLMGVLLAASNLPRVLLSPVGGAIADRFSRVRIIAGCDAVGGIALGALAWMVHHHGDRNPHFVIPVLFGTAVLLGVLMAFVNPAVASTIPDVVPPKRLSAANSMNRFVVRSSVFLGQATGGVLYHHLGGVLLFAADAVSFLLASASEAMIRVRHRGDERARRTPEAGGVRGADAPDAIVPASATATARAALRRFAGEIGEGFAHVREKPGLLAFLVATSSFNFFTMPLLVLLPFYVTQQLRETAHWYGFLLAATSLGTVTGFVLASTLRVAPRTRSRLGTALMLAAPAVFAILGWTSTPWVALAASYSLGLKTGIIAIYLTTALQATVPRALRGRVLGLVSTLTGGLAPLGMALGGIAGDLTGKSFPPVAYACAGAAFLLAVVTVPRRSVREFLAYEA